MVALYFPKNWRHYKVFMIMMAVELPFTIAILTFTGIASHDRYRTKLRQDGYDNGFNSAPDEKVYAAANYKHFEPPMVWSSFLTHFNLVIGVVSTFILIVKAPIHILRVFYPPLSVFIHVGLAVIYIVSARYQAGSDMADPKHPQPGPPWYITKSCSVAAYDSNIGYCKQAKALFAFSIMMIVIYVVEVGLSVHSCFLSKEEKEERREKREEKQVMKDYEETIIKSPGMAPMSPRLNTGGLQPATPRTLAFNRIGGDSSNLPLRDYNQRLPEEPPAPQSQFQTYFPPPPKKETK